jgi:hypothetical protein
MAPANSIGAYGEVVPLHKTDISVSQPIGLAKTSMRVADQTTVASLGKGRPTGHKDPKRMWYSPPVEKLQSRRPQVRPFYYLACM